jgi:hypothetical protein
MKSDSLIGAKTVMAPKMPPGITLITVESFDRLQKEWEDSMVLPEDPPEEPKPVKMQIMDISRDGNT